MRFSRIGDDGGATIERQGVTALRVGEMAHHEQVLSTLDQSGHGGKRRGVGGWIRSALNAVYTGGGGAGWAIGACPISGNDQTGYGKNIIGVTPGDVIELPIIIFVGCRWGDHKPQRARNKTSKTIKKRISVFVVGAATRTAGYE